MELLMQVLQTLLFLAKAGLIVSIIVVSAMIGTYASDEIKEWKLERSLELARVSDAEDWLAGLVAKARANRSNAPHKPKHRFNAGENHYARSVDDTYLLWASDKKKYESLPVDDSWAAALLKEQKELAPLWT